MSQMETNNQPQLQQDNLRRQSQKKQLHASGEGPSPPTNSIVVRIKRSQKDAFDEGKLIAILNKFGSVLHLHCNTPKVFVTYSQIAEAQAAHKSLHGKGQLELNGVKTFSEFVSDSQVQFKKNVSATIGTTTQIKNLQFPGLYMKEDFLSEEDEKELLQEFDEDKLWLEEVTRRTQHFGYAYDYGIQGCDFSKPIAPFPPLLKQLVDRVMAEQILLEYPNQITLQEYTPGQGIPPHIDTVWAFSSEILSISLLSHCVMRFKPVFVVGVDPNTKVDVLFPRRAVLKMTQDARYMWSHMIPARKTDVVDSQLVSRGRRLSLTFRKVLPHNSLVVGTKAENTKTEITKQTTTT